MNIKEALKAEHSKAVTTQIVNYVGKDKKRFKELMALFQGKDNRLSQRASWPVGYCGVDHPELILPYLKQMIADLHKPVHNAIKRNTLRIMAELDLPDELIGEAADISFTFLDDPKEAIATRVFAMSVCFNITKKEPELANELKLIIEDHFPHSTAGFKSRGKRILKELRKMQGST